MLVLSRKVNDTIVIGQNIELESFEIRGRIVRIGIKRASLRYEQAWRPPLQEGCLRLPLSHVRFGYRRLVD